MGQRGRREEKGAGATEVRAEGYSAATDCGVAGYRAWHDDGGRAVAGLGTPRVAISEQPQSLFTEGR